MNTRLMMTTSALLMGASGIVLSFFPDEILPFLTTSKDQPLLALVLQILGALYFAFAMTNWMAKGSLIGGIYGRPIAIGNFTHYLIGAFALLKGAFHHPDVVTISASSLYFLFAVWFGIALFTHPVK